LRLHQVSKPRRRGAKKRTGGGRKGASSLEGDGRLRGDKSIKQRKRDGG